ncbi:MAG TPA: PAS domain S-box protein, partial [Thermoplasmatales archaeon]|nr:PAS domain S-box protein [Thermoplasmatales archaeon]
EGSTTLIAGPSGTGKTILSLQFLVEGLKRGESCFYMGFEESKDQLFRNAMGFGWDLESFERDGLLTVSCVYPGDKLLEEHLRDIIRVVEEKKIKRCVIDSLSALSNNFDRNSVSEFSLRLNGFLKNHGVTTLFTSITGAVIGSSTLAESKLSSITDNIIMLRYVEMQGRLESVINVLKMRGSTHDNDLKRYRITDKGIVVEESLTNYEGVMTGVSKKIAELQQESEELREALQAKEETERKLMEYAKRFEQLFNNIVDAVVIVDSKGNFLEVNDTVEKVTGFKKEELIGKNFLKMPIVTRKSKMILIKNLMKRMAGMKIKPYTVTVLTKDGRKIPYEVNAARIEYNGEPADIVSFREITHRSSTENTIEPKILENLSQKIFQKNKDLIYVYVNDAYANFLGYPVEEILGKTDYELLGKEAEKIESEDKQVISTGKTFLFKETIKNDEIYTIKIPLFDEDEKIDGICGMILENPILSEEKPSEKELEEKWI